jgi:hypothetical protein
MCVSDPQLAMLGHVFQSVFERPLERVTDDLFGRKLDFPELRLGHEHEHHDDGQPERKADSEQLSSNTEFLRHESS